MNRAHRVCRLPVRPYPVCCQHQHPRGQPLLPDAGQYRKALVLIGSERLATRALANRPKKPVARLLMPARCIEADAAMNRRTHPVAQLAPRRTGSALRVMRCHHRLPKAYLNIHRDLGQRDRAQIGKPKPKRMVRIVRDPPGGATSRAEPRPHLRQRIALRAETLRTSSTDPAFQAAKITGKQIPRATLFGNRIAEPTDGLSPKLMETNMHAWPCNRNCITESAAGRSEAPDQAA